ncbi:MAG: hypothetical protein IT385_03360 [Deltaproteobacteria bacterium]|nr:hypothetical protein [Deltaproteobacteria bacterium]
MSAATSEGSSTRPWSRAWWRTLLAPRTAGMDPSTPSASPWVFLLLSALLALQVIARYKLGFLDGKEWQLAHVAIGWAIVLGVLALAHGPGMIRRVGGRTWALLAVGMIFLMLFWYVGRSDGYRDLFGAPPYETETLAPLYPFAYFALGAVAYRMLLPFVFARFALGRGPRSLGLPVGRIGSEGAGHLRGVGWIYLGLFVLIAGPLVIASQFSDYLAKYPLARDIISPELGIWIWHFVVYEALYALVFVSGEAFWRGYLTFGTERDLGLYGISLMLVPYVTGHFGKPFSETLGAIVAGSLLGFLALKHRSVWFGVALHYGVALSMDLLAVWRNGIVIHG